MEIFEFSDYLEFIQHWQKTKRIDGKPARGNHARIAEALGVHTTLVSLLFSGKRLLTIEQACDLADFWEFSELEKDYFLTMLQRARSGNKSAKSFFDQKLKSLKEQSLTVAPRLSQFKELSESDKSIFYSSWLYSAVRLFCSTQENGRSLEDIMSHFRLTRIHALEIVTFLSEKHLVIYKDSFYKMATQSTHLKAKSKHVVRHHLNWRMKSQIKADHLSDEELMFTSPFSVSQKDFLKIKKLLLNLIQESSSIIKESPSEEVACLNLDLFLVD